MLNKLYKLLSNPRKHYKKIIPYLKFKKYIALRKIFIRKRFQIFFKKMHDLSLEGMAVGAWGEKEFCGKYLKLSCGSNGGVVLDVGANIGEYAQDAAQSADNIKVVCFEPNPRIFLKLKEKFKDNPNYFLHNLACGKENRSVELYDFDIDSNYSGAHTSFFRETLDQLNINKYQISKHAVKCVILDDFITENKIERVNLLKIDVEGAEFEVLKGLEKSLKRGIIDAIQFEFNFHNIESRCYFKDFFVLLNNFNFFRTLPTGYLLPLSHYDPKYCEIFVYQNIVAIRKDLDVSKIVDN